MASILGTHLILRTRRTLAGARSALCLAGYACVAVLCIRPCLAQEAPPVLAHERDGSIDISNGFVRAVFTEDARGVEQTFLAANGGQWVEVLRAFRPPDPRPSGTTELYLDRSTEYGRALEVADEFRVIVPSVLRTVAVDASGPEEAHVTLFGKTGLLEVTQRVSIRRGEPHIHIDVTGTFQRDPPQLEYLLSPFAFARSGSLDFSHAPGYKRSPGDVIGDRVFFSPAAIVQTDSLFAALLPDLDTINEHVVYAEKARPQKYPWILRVPIDSSKISMPAVLDLELASGMTPQPLLAYGMMDVIAEHHFYWRHLNAGGTFVRTLSGGEVRYGMDLLLSAAAEENRGYQVVSPFLWERYGRRHLQEPRPQALPFAEYARRLYPASFDYDGYTIRVENGEPVMDQREAEGTTWNSWQEWEKGGLPMGSQRLAPPFWYHLTYNAAWWNNVGDATGFYYWGHALADSSLIDKARRIVNLALSSPQQEGLFPSFYNLDDGTWVPSPWEFPQDEYDPDETKNYWNWVDGDYHTAASSVTAGFLMQIYRLWEKDQRILDFVRRYGSFLVRRMQPDGSIPSWFSSSLEARPPMRWNAEGGVHAWVLAELYRATGEVEWLRTAERAAAFLIREVLPQQRWVDFEALYSCAVKPETFFDERTGQPPRNTMSMSWALEAFIALYEITENAQYLDAAERVADYATLLQTVWDPHYIITAYPFGGFSSQIGDAEWMDQRDHRFVSPLIRLGLHTGRQDFLERAVAAARSSLALVTLPEHAENDIYRAQTFPYGVGPENIDHEGVPQTPLRSGPSWSEVGGLMAAAHALKHLGGLYINVEQDVAVGVDGVAVTGYRFQGRTLHVSVQKLLHSLSVPYASSYDVLFKVEGLPSGGPYTLVTGGQSFSGLSVDQFRSGYVVTIHP